MGPITANALAELLIEFGFEALISEDARKVHALRETATESITVDARLHPENGWTCNIRGHRWSSSVFLNGHADARVLDHVLGGHIRGDQEAA